jgi:hypothetical protein
MFIRCIGVGAHSFPARRLVLFFVTMTLFLSRPVVASDQLSETTVTGKTSNITLTVEKDERTVFHHATQSCDTWDIPDASARAYRDAQDNIHLIASHSSNRALIGTDFEHLVRDCTIVFQGASSPDPESFNDEGWIEAVYSPDGQRVFAFISMDYHPYRHGLPCGSNQETKYQCWYSAITMAESSDRGFTFQRSRQNLAFVLGPVRRFDPMRVEMVGAFVPTNIIRVGDFFYTMVSVVTGDSGGSQSGECLIRTSHLEDPASWRGWGDTGFDVVFSNPYQPREGYDESRPCRLIGRGVLYPAVRSLLKLKDDNGFIAVMLKYESTKEGPSGIYVAHSFDMITWTQRSLLLSLKVFSGRNCEMGKDRGYQYPSVISINDSSRNFENAEGKSYLFLTRFNRCGYSDRDLVSFPLQISYGTL